MKILFIGDIVGGIGRAAVKKILPRLRKKYNPDIVIANVENLAHGKGVTEATLREMREAGINYFTGGNHIFAKKNYPELLNDPSNNLLRPANYPPGTAGAGDMLITVNPHKTGSPRFDAAGKTGQKNILLVNLMGRVFFREHLDCPFRAFDAILKKYETKGVAAVIVDFHAEATSEKNALRWYADGRAAAVLGTHTHVPIADEDVSAGGTAYITDVGGVMARYSVLGVDKDIIIKNFISQVPLAHEFPDTRLT